MNKKGFAVSGIIYSILILFLILLFGILSIMGARKMILDKLKNEVMEELNSGEISVEQGESLISLLLKQYNSDNTTGLVKDSTNEDLYYYTGTNEEVANNFLWYGGHQWRVLEFDTSNNTITLITQQPLTSIQPASAVWTSEETYNNSYINTWLNDYFWNSLDNDIQSNILDNTFNIGIYTDVDEITTSKKVGLLDVEQYNRAGESDSYLDIKDAFWLGNRSNSSIVRYIDINGNLNHAAVSYCRGVRPVIKISDLIITEGDGSLASNYQVENKATNTNDVQVGEYINVPYSGEDNACGSDNMCTFRVVSKDENSIKIVLNGLLPTTSAWATDANDNISIDDLIYVNSLNTFIENIDSKYITAGTYGVGTYEDGNSYTVPQETIITAKVGLPTVGEMFSGNDIDMGNSKTFVDINTIENSTIEVSHYWTMNRFNATYVKYIRDNGCLNNYNFSNSQGIRAVIHLKSRLAALDFIGGKGTAQSPYILQ